MELKKFFQSKKINLNYNEIDYLIAIADIDGDGQINFYEFVNAFANQYSEINPNQLRQKFPV